MPDPFFACFDSVGACDVGTILSPEDTALVAEMDATVPELFLKLLAGSYQEGTIRCIMDIAETYPDRPAGMHDIARGQCRSLLEDPRRRRHIDMSSAKVEPRSFTPMDTVYEDELAEAIPNHTCSNG